MINDDHHDLIHLPRCYESGFASRTRRWHFRGGHPDAGQMKKAVTIIHYWNLLARLQLRIVCLILSFVSRWLGVMNDATDARPWEPPGEGLSNFSDVQLYQMSRNFIVCTGGWCLLSFLDFSWNKFDYLIISSILYWWILDEELKMQFRNLEQKFDLEILQLATRIYIFILEYSKIFCYWIFIGCSEFQILKI